jgi:hypothetical protein
VTWPMCPSLIHQFCAVSFILLPWTMYMTFICRSVCLNTVTNRIKGCLVFKWSFPDTICVRFLTNCDHSIFGPVFKWKASLDYYKYFIYIKWSRVVLPLENRTRNRMVKMKRPFENWTIPLKDTNWPFKYQINPVFGLSPFLSGIQLMVIICKLTTFKSEMNHLNTRLVWFSFVHWINLFQMLYAIK